MGTWRLVSAGLVGFALVAGVMPGLGRGAGAAPQDGPAPKASADMDGTPLVDVLRRLATAAGKTILYQDRIGAVKTYAIVPKAPDATTLLAFVCAVLELNGFALVRFAEGTPSEVWEVVESRNTRRYPMPMFRGAEVLADPSRFPTHQVVVTITHALKYASARDVSNALRPFLDPNTGGQIIGIEGVETLMITDFAPNALRLLQTAALADVPARPAAIGWRLVTVRKSAADAAIAHVVGKLAAERPAAVGRLALVDLQTGEGTVTIQIIGVPKDVDWAEGVLTALDQAPGAAPAAGGKSR